MVGVMVYDHKKGSGYYHIMLYMINNIEVNITLYQKKCRIQGTHDMNKLLSYCLSWRKNVW